LFAVRKGSGGMIRIVLMCFFLVFNTILDIKTKKLPTTILVCFCPIGIIVNFFQPEYSGKELALGAVVGLVLLVVSYVASGQIGSGDGILFVVTGLFIGGINNFCLLLWASVLCAVFAGVLLITKKVTGKDRIPFVPFVLISYLGQVIL